MREARRPSPRRLLLATAIVLACPLAGSACSEDPLIPKRADAASRGRGEVYGRDDGWAGTKDASPEDVSFGTKDAPQRDLSAEGRDARPTAEQGALQGVIRIYDTNKKYDYKHYGFDAYKDKSSWSLVPYGTAAGYAFKGDPVIEGESFWIDMKSSDDDAMFIYFKRPGGNGEPVSAHIEHYRVFDTPNGLRNYGGGTEVAKVRVLKNTAGEILVEHHTVPHTRGGYPTEIVTNFRVLPGRRWLEELPIQQADELGAHGESRIGIVPEVGEGGNDLVCDAFLIKKEGWFPSPDDKTKMLLSLKKHDGDIMYTMAWPPAPKSAYAAWSPSRGRFDLAQCGSTQGWTPPAGNTCAQPTWSYWTITSPFVNWAGKRIVFGMLNHAGIFHFEEKPQTVQMGQKVVMAWPTPYAGRWRLSARIDGKYYTNENNVGAGAQQSIVVPAAGKLEYLVTYLYARNGSTPSTITTPKDVYQEAGL